MITRDNQTRQQLNQAARERLKRTGVLPEHGEQIALTEYAPGDRVIARRNDRGRDIDNGTLGTITDIDTRAQHMLVRTDSGQLRALDYDYVISHLQHAYALTAHGAQGATVDWAGVIGRPEEFTRQWAYTALSRARAQTTLHVIAEPTAATSDRAQYAPTEPKRDVKKTLNALQHAMKTANSSPSPTNTAHYKTPSDAPHRTPQPSPYAHCAGRTPRPTAWPTDHRRGPARRPGADHA